MTQRPTSYAMIKTACEDYLAGKLPEMAARMVIVNELLPKEVTQEDINRATAELEAYAPSLFGVKNIVRPPLKYGSDEWRNKILDPKTAIAWAIHQEKQWGAHDAMDFMRDWMEGSVFGISHAEYRYWATGVHEPDSGEE